MSDLIIEPVALLLPVGVQRELHARRAREAAEALRLKYLVGDGAAEARLPRRFRRQASKNRARLERRVVRAARREADA